VKCRGVVEVSSELSFLLRYNVQSQNGFSCLW
jgi:hypothetical protein